MPNLFKVKEKSINFLKKRRHSSGGYTLYEGLPDSKNTYYALKSFRVLGFEPPEVDRTLDWIEDLHSRGGFAAQGLFYRCSILKTYDRDFRITARFMDLLKGSYQKSKLEITYYIDSVLRMHGEYVEGIPQWVLSLQNDDGGFGKYGSDIINTYFAVEILDAHGVKIQRNNLMEFTDSCYSDGAWNFTPLSYPPYIETAYSGFRLNEILRGKVSFNFKDFLLRIHNPDGGFRRSMYMGISEPEYTYMALYMLFSEHS